MNPQTDKNQPQNHPAEHSDTQIYSRSPAQQVPTQDQTNAAARVAHIQAEHVYDKNPPNQLKQDSPYQQTHQPVFDWQNYHTAWQKYYQQYYERYYANQLEAERQRHESEKAQQSSQLAWQTVTGSDQIEVPKSRAQQLRDDLLAKVKDRANKFRKSSHFLPILSAVAVGAIFLFLQYNRVVAAQVEAYISPGSTVDSSDTVIVDPAANANVGNDPRIIIPKVNVNVPVVYDVTTVEDGPVQNALERGVVHYNLPGANSMPGQAGNTVILGHSSNDVFDPGSYKFAFVLIDKLQNGDVFYMNYQGKRYVYKVTDKKVIKPTEWRVLQEAAAKPQVVLVTCTPIGTATNRLLVYGEQISPDPASASAKPQETDTKPATIPGNSPTFFERLKNLFF